MSTDNREDRDRFNDNVVEDLVRDLRDAQFTTSTNEQSDKDDKIENKNSENQNIPPDLSDSSNEDNDEDGPDVDKNDVDVESDEELIRNRDLNLSDKQLEQLRTETILLKNQGNDEFKNEKYLESIETYTKALKLCPLKYNEDRAILYANRAACKIKIDHKISAIEDCSKAIKLNDRYVRAYLRRAKLYEENDKLDESLDDYKKILELDPGNKEAIIAQQRLPPLINERNEKLKTEMLGKLKDLGNLFLRPFGLSTDNFNLQQDPNTGGYSVNFQQKP